MMVQIFLTHIVFNWVGSTTRLDYNYYTTLFSIGTYMAQHGISFQLTRISDFKVEKGGFLQPPHP